MSTVRDMPELKTMPYLKLKRWMIANGCLKAEADRCDLLGVARVHRKGSACRRPG